MNDDEINILSGNNYSEVAQILENFININENVYTFNFLLGNNRRVYLWTALFQHLQLKSSESIHVLCLRTIKLLSRDKIEIENLICEKWIIELIEKAGLFNFVDPEDYLDVNMPVKEVVVEALKCLCNITFNSKQARGLCAYTIVAQGLVARLRAYKEIPFKDEIMLYDMKLLFIVTALRQDIKAQIKDELHGMDYLISCLNELILEASESQCEVAGSSKVIEEAHCCFLLANQQAIACEILKIQFNLTLGNSEDTFTEAEESMYLKLMPVLTALLSAQTSTQGSLMDLYSDVANLLTGLPPIFYQYLTPELNDGETAQYTYAGRNMDAMQALLQLLRNRIGITIMSYDTKHQYSDLSPVLLVLIKCARACSPQRKFLRQVVLPPLRDVSKPPERGGTLRNQLCRLLTTALSTVRNMVAEFLFVLCKEKVGRMVKYTGFGNAAGHLAQKGLLSGTRGPGQYSSSSEDSDTEEYREAQPRIDPVVGCTRPPRVNPFEGMSEEQKEFEAMKLVNLLDKMMTEGVMRPARIGDDGRPVAVDHVLDLREHPPNQPQS